MATKTTADPRTSKLGALTTQWTAPASCSTEWLASVAGLGTDTTVDAWFRPSMRCGASTAELDPSCFPSPYGASVTQMLSRFATPFFSPGLSCPYGWKSDGLTFGTGLPTSLAYTLNLEADETAAMCCPTGWQYGDGIIGCTSAPLTGTPTALACLAGTTSTVTVSYPAPRGFASGSFSAAGTTYSVWTWAHMDPIQLVWKTADLSLLHPVSTTPTPPSASATPPHIPSPSHSQPPQNHSSTLPTPAKLALAIALPLAWCALFLLLALLLLRRYRVLRSRAAAASQPQPELESAVIAQGSAYMGPPHPLPHWPVAELQQPVPELEGRRGWGGDGGG